MDITTVESFRAARTRDDLALAPGEIFLAGGTWLMSEPLAEASGFVDLTTMSWDPLEITADGLRIAATCTIADLVAWAHGRLAIPVPDGWVATSMIPDAANALLASFKIWNTATVGGNICRAFPAAAMVSLAVALDATAEVWTPDGGARRLAVADLVIGAGRTSLAPGEVLRAIDIPASALRSHALLKKIALAELGRSAAVVTGRLDIGGAATFAVTAATEFPVVRRYERLPDAAALAADIATIPCYSDPLGAADWRRAVSGVLAERIRRELAGDRRAP
ncbi:FAD binding domain-containing protein [Microbacterium sp. BWT-B31]|uniref:FAD binding domain-containing protein n=1 Tax=Microbacterium sp. BWT-B31 TaxID=3232072 RepID=UPI003527BDCB